MLFRYHKHLQLYQSINLSIIQIYSKYTAAQVLNQSWLQQSVYNFNSITTKPVTTDYS